KRRVSGSKTLVPVMSLGRRSGVNWMRRNDGRVSLGSGASDSPSARASVVLPEPGKSSSSTWPSAKSAMSRRSITASRPFTAARRRRRSRAAISLAESTERGWGAPAALVERWLFMRLPRAEPREWIDDSDCAPKWVFIARQLFAEAACERVDRLPVEAPLAAEGAREVGVGQRPEGGQDGLEASREGFGRLAPAAPISELGEGVELGAI